MLNKKKVVISGGSGFVGRNFIGSYGDDFIIKSISHSDCIENIENILNNCDIYIHLAAVQRPVNSSDFYKWNYMWTKNIYERLPSTVKKVIFASTQNTSTSSNYFKSKRIGEVLTHRLKNKNIDSYSIRFPNLFGCNGRPFHTSVIHTLLYAMSHREPVTINNVDTLIKFSRVESITRLIKFIIEGEYSENLKKRPYIEPSPDYEISLGELFNIIYRIHCNKDHSKSEKALISELKKAYRYYAEFEINE